MYKKKIPFQLVGVKSSVDEEVIGEWYHIPRFMYY